VRRGAAGGGTGTAGGEPAGAGPSLGLDEPLEYKVVEVATVTDEELERVINAAVGEGWRFDGFHFAMRESSRRPSMAFVTFFRRRPDAGER
jgi:hypothetical protein